MAYLGCTIAFDLASVSGIAEGCAGETPRFSVERFRKPHDTHPETFGRAIGFVADRLSAERFIGGRLYGRGEALDAGLVRVVIEAPIMTGLGGATNADTLLVTKGLWAAVSGFAHRRGARVECHPVSTIRKAFIGSGKLPGPEAKREARRVCQGLGWDPPNLDAADAGALWWFACRAWNPEATPDVRPLFLAAQGRAA